MVRLPLASALLLVLAAQPALAAFGSGPLEFREYEVPEVDGAPEPTIGINWKTDALFYHSLATTMRATWDGDEPTWRDVTPPYQVPRNLDPMLVTDAPVGRTFAGGLAGPCSVMMVTDDDGATWVPAGNMCSGLRFDHQSLGVGPAAGPIPTAEGGRIAYYCGQAGAIACARSIDHGQTWLPFQDVPGPCGGFHGHIRVAPDGFVAVPVAACGDDHGFVSSEDGGLTWKSNRIPGTETWTNGFDPSLQFTGSGWMYYAMAGEHGIHAALSKDKGKTWEPLGAGGEHWLDIGQFHDPPVVSGVFTNVQTGDDDRVAVSFIGLEGGPGKDLKFLRSPGIYQCEERQDELVWHYYVAVSYDAGRNWTVERISKDPVQVGGIYDVIVDGSGACRNLLDFQDMDVDSKGRIHIGWADGCTRACAEQAKPRTQGWRDDAARLFRQVGGKGLLAAHDVMENATTTPTVQPTEEAQPTPGLTPVLAVAALAAVAVAARRRLA